MKLLLTYLALLLALLGCLPALASPLDGIWVTRGNHISIHGLLENDPALEFSEKILRIDDDIIEVVRRVGQRWDNSVYRVRIANKVMTFSDPGFDWNETGRVSYRDTGDSIILFNKGCYEIYSRLTKLPDLNYGEFEVPLVLPSVAINWRVGDVTGAYALTEEELRKLLSFNRISVPYRGAAPTGSYRYSFHSGGSMNRVKYKFSLRTFLVGADPLNISNYQLVLNIHRLKYPKNGGIPEEILIETESKPVLFSKGEYGEAVAQDGERLYFRVSVY